MKDIKCGPGRGTKRDKRKKADRYWKSPFHEFQFDLPFESPQEVFERLAQEDRKAYPQGTLPEMVEKRVTAAEKVAARKEKRKQEMRGKEYWEIMQKHGIKPSL